MVLKVIHSIFFQTVLTEVNARWQILPWIYERKSPNDLSPRNKGLIQR